MSPEPQIIDTMVIQVKSTTKDGYGNLIVTPEVGEIIKISEKRAPLFDIFQQGRAVKLYWAEYMHKKYVARAELFDGKPPLEKQVEPITAGVEVPHLQTIPGQEHGLWVKEIGEWLRKWAGEEGLTDEAKAIREAMRLWYFAEMKRVLGITVKKGKEITHCD